ncbi:MULTISPECIES: acyl-CoA dehydrogenase [Halococcus]|uniref:acyl-CoA dehydrogenase n=1 Tax=Halococcus TaxID=2249 RepID=UPI0009B5D3EB|nr:MULTISPECIES: acyl-CoA dehydrogenase [Halococcus]
MSNFKSGSGNLDFGNSDGDTEEDEEVSRTGDTQSESNEGQESTSPEQFASSPAEKQTSQTDDSSEQPVSEQYLLNKSTVSSPQLEEYPYFVRRNNVGDERDNRLEIQLRDEIASQEAKFLNVLAEQLETNEIAKTDAREFALLMAFQNPKSVAKLMRSEEFGAFG